MTKLAVAMAVAAMATTGARAQLFTGSSTTGGSAISASATISLVSPGELELVLVNTEDVSAGGYAVSVADTLYGIVLDGNVNITSIVSAYAPSGDVAWTLNNNPPTSTTLGANTTLPWAIYHNGVSGAENGGNGKNGLVPNGLNFTSGNEDNVNGFSSSNHNPAYANEAIFFLDYSGTYSSTSISNVVFSYGTDGASTMNGTPTPNSSVPEASTIMAGALMLLPLGIGTIRALRRERRLAKI